MPLDEEGAKWSWYASLCGSRDTLANWESDQRTMHPWPSVLKMSAFRQDDDEGPEGWTAAS